MRASRLARRRDVVVLTLHRHKSGRSNRREVYLLAASSQLALPDGALLVDVANNVQEYLRRNIHLRRIEIQERKAQRIFAIVIEHLPEELTAFADVAG